MVTLHINLVLLLPVMNCIFPVSYTHLDRRFKEYQEKQIEADYQQIYDDIEKRDYQDSHRDASPLKKADDAIEIDTSNMNIEEVIQYIKQLLVQKGLCNA